MTGDLIFVSMENWDDIWRRNQFVCAELARRHEDLKILFVGLPRNISHGVRHGRFRELWQAATYPGCGFPNITITHSLKLFPDSIPAGRESNERMFRRHVRTVAAALGMERPVLWLNPHSAVHMVGQMGESAVVYDITDDWTTLSQSPRVSRRIRQQDARLCQKADAVIVCSERLHDLKRSLVPKERLHLIPNGVHVEHYRGVLDGSAPVARIARDWPRPVMGYTGTIHPDRIDVTLVRKLANTPGIGSVALVGPNQLQPGDLEILRLPNVYMPGPVSYADIPDVMRAFDVCIVPHRVTPFTESLNPIKLWEYLAAGKPIVSTNIAGFRDFPNLVSIATTPDEFVAATLRALSEEAVASGARRAEAGKHGWMNRVDHIEAALSGLTSRTGDTQSVFACQVNA
jgi:teichuronic acid biosynthesis glycosyltransferase TuaH